jgi:hypothetical protein
MVFALNYPMMGLWFEKVEAAPKFRRWGVKGLAAVGVGGLGLWWAVEVLPLPKPQYNATNPYFAAVYHIRDL